MYENEESPCRKKMKKKILSAPYIFVKAIITSHITLIFKVQKDIDIIRSPGQIIHYLKD